MHIGRGSFKDALLPLVPAARSEKPLHRLTRIDGKVAVKLPVLLAWTVFEPPTLGVRRMVSREAK